MARSINIDFELSASVSLGEKAAKSVVSKFAKKSGCLSFNISLGLGDGFTSFGNDDVVSGDLMVSIDAASKNGEITFRGTVSIDENNTGTVIPYFLKPANVVQVTGISLTIVKGDRILEDHEFEMACPVKWKLAGESSAEVSSNNTPRKKMTGTMSIGLARLSRIETADVCAEDPDQVVDALNDTPEYVELIKRSRAKVTACWDLDSDMVTNVQVNRVKVASIAVGERPALKTVEIAFSVDANEDSSEEDIESELMAGLMPLIEMAGTKFVFFDCDELSCRFG